jgi:SAM-dependent methyltransferase
VRFVTENGIAYEVLPWSQQALKLIVDPYRNWLLPARLLQWIVRKSRSPLVAETLRRPGSWQSMKIVYANETPVDAIDRMAVRYNTISMATRNRRKLVTAKLTEVFSSMAGESPISVVGVGAGPGLHVQDAICRAGLSPTQVDAYLIDRDSDAFEYGQQCARERGLVDSIHFVQGDAREIRQVLPAVSPNVVKIIGLLEYLTDAQATELLAAMFEVMAADGRLLTHGMVDRFNTARFVARTFGLRHVHRTGDHVAKLLRSVGFREIETFDEPMKIYSVLLAKR